MKILITGACGTVGQATVREALGRGHEVTAFIRPTRRNERIARRLKSSIRGAYSPGALHVHWGDMRSREDLQAAVDGHDAVIHLAAMLPPVSDKHPDLCHTVNVGGTRNLVAALSAQRGASSNGGPALVYASSVSVMGSTQEKDPPLTVGDPPRPSDVYSSSKMAAEAVVGESSIPWAILRLSAVMPTRGVYRPSMAKLMFGMSLDARCEVVVDRDVAYALVQAAEDLCDGGAMRRKSVFIAGGRANGCQMDIEEMLTRNLEPVGLKLPSRRLFRTDLDSYYLDWYETEEGQRILGYQRHSVDDWRRLSYRRFRTLRWVLWPVRWPANLYLEWVGRRERAARYPGPGSLPTRCTRRSRDRLLP